mmetsp:Transcript_50311/g.100347  ORF Transcript_50311/g.100347 Transcript_50311/m.100347 type:complete len:225 (+) Transcript_50311:971-1645(+)
MMVHAVSDVAASFFPCHANYSKSLAGKTLPLMDESGHQPASFSLLIRSAFRPLFFSPASPSKTLRPATVIEASSCSSYGSSSSCLSFGVDRALGLRAVFRVTSLRIPSSMLSSSSRPENSTSSSLTSRPRISPSKILRRPDERNVRRSNRSAMSVSEVEGAGSSPKRVRSSRALRASPLAIIDFTCCARVFDEHWNCSVTKASCPSHTTLKPGSPLSPYKLMRA